MVDLGVFLHVVDLGIDIVLSPYPGSPQEVRTAFFSNGGGPMELGSHESPYLERMAASGSEMLDELL
jgi:hypothetical protein